MSLESGFNFSKLTKAELLDTGFLQSIYETDDDVILGAALNAIEDRARELKCLKQLQRIIKPLDKERAEIAKSNNAYSKNNSPAVEVANVMNFPSGFSDDFETLKCGQWIANSAGVKKYSPTGESIASYFPILPVCYYQNVNSGLEKVEIGYYKEGHWNFRVLYRSEICSVQEMIRKSNYGFPVTSKTALPLIDYLQQVEALNEGVIPIKKSTTKMGWHRTENNLEFMPYTDEFAFDGGSDYNDLYGSLHSQGDYDEWLVVVKNIRATNRFEPLLFMAASFASPLLELLGVQSFAIDLWGSTEGGKTVTTRLAASIWGDCKEGKYVGNFQSTEVAYEIKQGFLNNLPMFIDDSSNIKDKDHFNYSTFIYNRCNEKGKSRSNIARGIELEYTWRHIILMTGEQPFITESAQGGAINRTLEIACGASAIYEKPVELCDFLDNNYGFAGKEFIECVKAITPYKLKERFKRQLERVNKLDKMKKQSNALAAILTADEIAEEFIFKDGVIIDLETAASILTEKETVSEDIRCYEYLLEQVTIFSDHFNPLLVDKDTNEASFKSDQWGLFDEAHGVVYIIKSAFDRLCKQGSYSPKRFLDWALKHDKIVPDGKGNPTRIKWYGKTNSRSVCLRLRTDEPEDTFETEQENEMEGVPF